MVAVVHVHADRVEPEIGSEPRHADEQRGSRCSNADAVTGLRAAPLQASPRGDCGQRERDEHTGCGEHVVRAPRQGLPSSTTPGQNTAAHNANPASAAGLDVRSAINASTAIATRATGSWRRRARGRRRRRDRCPRRGRARAPGARVRHENLGGDEGEQQPDRSDLERQRSSHDAAPLGSGVLSAALRCW